MISRLRPLAPYFLVALGACAVPGLSYAIGRVGAPRGEHFDWRLAAEVGTALGTVLLATYTAWLATTTRQEVRIATQEQQARDRPVVVVSAVDVGGMALDQMSQETIPILVVWMKNVGLGPALDLHLRATYPDQEVVAEEVIAVIAVDETINDRPISLSSLAEPEGGFELDQFTIEGDFEDRTRRGRHEVTVLTNAGLRDEQRAAQARAMTRARLELIPGSPVGGGFNSIEYVPTVLNNGPAAAADVELQLLDDETSEGYSDPVAVGPMPAYSQKDVQVSARRPYPPLTCCLTWTDDDGPQKRLFEGPLYPAMGSA